MIYDEAWKATLLVHKNYVGKICRCTHVQTKVAKMQSEMSGIGIWSVELGPGKSQSGIQLHSRGEYDYEYVEMFTVHTSSFEILSYQ